METQELHPEITAEQQEDTREVVKAPSELVTTPALTTESIGILKQDAQELRESENSHEQDTYNKYLKTVKELRSFVEMGAIDQDSADEILALLLARGELNSLMDEKTGLIGEKGFNLILEKNIAHSQRTGEGFSVLYLDLKGFKATNDEEGHQRGDEILQLVGEYLTTSVRKEDVVSHLHGDEFALLLPRATEEASQEKFDVTSLAYQLPIYIRSKLLEQNKEPNNAIVTARAGFASFEPGDTVDSIKHKADMDMNAAKKDELHQTR